jgi:hypothetical protein
MLSILKSILIAPIIDKEHLVVAGWGYDKQLSDVLYTVTHIDTLPNPQADYEDRNVALRKYAAQVQAPYNNTLTLFMGLW